MYHKHAIMNCDFSLIERLTDRDEFCHVVSCINKNMLFLFALTCRAAYKAVMDLKEPIKTTIASLVSSIALIKWAVDHGTKERLSGRKNENIPRC